MKKLIIVMMLFLSTVSVNSFAQKVHQDELEKVFFPPELVMRYQNEIELQPDQRETIKKTMQEAQSKFAATQWDLQSEMQSFKLMLSKTSIDEQKAKAQLEKILELEKVVKQTQIGLMIRIKNTLTPQQQQQLTALKES